MANFYWNRQQPHLARPHLDAAVAMEPDSAEARGWLGQVCFEMGQLQDAQREYEAALRLSPHDGRLLGNVGLLYERLGAKLPDWLSKWIPPASSS